ncbi:hypothetical protein [Arsenophonus nasoniae]|uniref:hypothetical protein n=1 Tax=Arsenophonus nasoniae TaxID=638 RepID=UPI0038790200
MSKDDKTEQNRTVNSPITFEEFAFYLQQIGENIQCPLCKNTQWELFAKTTVQSQFTKENINYVTTLPVTSNIFHGDSLSQMLQVTSNNVLIMNCNNCGYINLLNYEFVYNKIKKTKRTNND